MHRGKQTWANGDTLLQSPIDNTELNNAILATGCSRRWQHRLASWVTHPLPSQAQAPAHPLCLLEGSHTLASASRQQQSADNILQMRQSVACQDLPEPPLHLLEASMWLHTTPSRIFIWGCYRNFLTPCSLVTSAQNLRVLGPQRPCDPWATLAVQNKQLQRFMATQHLWRSGCCCRWPYTEDCCPKAGRGWRLMYRDGHSLRSTFWSNRRAAHVDNKTGFRPRCSLSRDMAGVVRCRPAGGSACPQQGTTQCCGKLSVPRCFIGRAQRLCR